ncbi:hypothetical protein C8R47DRAFT_1069902 [Mycena vitilis]|nr:hypothetical protein C8R47DRAFT_1069902 [Mycena vitilis]
MRFFLRSSGLQIPVSTSASMASITWVALNADLNLLPTRAYDFVDRTDYQNVRTKTTSHGFYSTIEWSHEPDWFRVESWWRAWIPVMDNDTRSSAAWYLRKDAEMHLHFRSEFQNYVIPGDRRDLFYQTMNEVFDCVAAITNSPKFPQGTAFPSTCDMDLLNRAYPTLIEGTCAIAQIKRAIRDGLGFINWWSEAVVNADLYFFADVKEKIASFALHSYKKRGVIISVARDFNAANCGFWIAHDMPVFYPWTAREESTIKFARLNPRLLGAYQEARKASGGANLQEQDFGLSSNESFVLMENYDEFCDYIEDSYQDPIALPTQIHEDARTSIIDFRGWKAREVTDQGWKEYYLKRLHYNVSGDARSPDCRLIFYRYLPKSHNEAVAYFITPSSEPPFLARRSSEDGMETDSVSLGGDECLELLDEPEDVRELYGPSLAPKPGQTFDPVTGLENLPPLTGTNRLKKFSETLDAAVPDTPQSSAALAHVNNVLRCMKQSQSYVDAARANRGLPTSTSVPQVPRGDAPNSLLSRLSDAPSIYSRNAHAVSLLGRLAERPLFANVSNPRPESEGRRRGRSPAQSHSQSSVPRTLYPLRRSASPNHRSRSSATSTTSRRESRNTSSAPLLPRGAFARRDSPIGLPRLLRPSTAQKQSLEQWRDSALLDRLVYEPANFELPDFCQWNPRFVSRAVLVVRDVDARVRLRLWASSGNVKEVIHLLNRAILKGVPFRLAFFSSEQRDFRKSREDQGERTLGGSMYARVESPLEYSSGDAALALEWKSRVLGVLVRPHARAFISLGGVPAWIARSIRPQLIADFMDGPSIQSTTLQRGWTDAAEKEPWDILADLVSNGEIEVLLGYTKDEHGADRWLFPRTEWLWDWSDHYSGELSVGVERMLHLLYEAVMDEKPKPRTRGQWKDYLRHNNHDDLAPSIKKTSREEFRAEEDDRMAKVFADDWNKIEVRNMVIPGEIR